ncbi:hypothetical protein BKA93DRAFT_710038, partial [Sparassis latifolia]
HGIVITCCDGVQRRFYPRIFTYSADYPEKILLASIRNMGQCPCPRCLIPLSRVHNIGKAMDMKQRETLARKDDAHRRQTIATARSLIYEGNLQVNCAAVENLLRDKSFVPTANAFSDRLSPFGFNMFKMFVVDLMHEWEIGTGRSIFTHLLRILESVDGTLLAELDRRFRAVPTFAGAIRHFRRNCSEMKQMAARDIEDILQCAIPVFDGLLPEPHNGQVLKLLFIAEHWHSLAKLRMHTDCTLQLLDDVTVSLGDTLRHFSEQTCKAFPTRELRREAEARARRESKKMAARADEAPVFPRSGGTARKPKAFNLDTYKAHALGDYPATIRWLGTTDSYSTEPGELEHRTSKARYARTSRKQYIRQITQIERHQARIRRIRERSQKKVRHYQDEGSLDAVDVHYAMGKSQNHPVYIPDFVRRNTGDPATKDFVAKLKKHLLPRIKAMIGREATFSGQEQSPLVPVIEDNSTRRDHDSVFFKGDRMYEHHILKVNYTTYDVRRSHDIINPSTDNRDILLLARFDDLEDATSMHPFLYARVLGIYHVNVVYTGTGMADYTPRRLDFLWVRWFQYVGDSRNWSQHKLDTVEFPPMADEETFGFIDPDDVLRACHIIPTFKGGKIHADEIGLSHCANDAEDWRFYHVNRFVDRDMLMRYHRGLGIGH